MAKRASLIALLAGTLMIAAAYASTLLPGDPPAWSAWAMGIGTATVMVAASALGAARAGLTPAAAGRYGTLTTEACGDLPPIAAT